MAQVPQPRQISFALADILRERQPEIVRLTIRAGQGPVGRDQPLVNVRRAARTLLPPGEIDKGDTEWRAWRAKAQRWLGVVLADPESRDLTAIDAVRKDVERELVITFAGAGRRLRLISPPLAVLAWGIALLADESLPYRARAGICRNCKKPFWRPEVTRTSTLDPDRKRRLAYCAESCKRIYGSRGRRS